MRFKFEKLGFVDRGELELGELTIICGSNNVGKTYVSYAIYGLLRQFKQWVDFSLSNDKLQQLRQQGTITLQLTDYQQQLPHHLNQAAQTFSKRLDHYFNTPEDFFSKTKLEFGNSNLNLNLDQEFKRVIRFGKTETLILDKAADESALSISLQSEDEAKLPLRILNDVISNEIAECLFDAIWSKPFVVTSERTGIALFYKELDISKNMLVEHISESEKIDPLKVLSMRARYAQPIHDNINVVRDYENLCKQKSFIRKDSDTYSHLLDALQSLLGGRFKYSNKQITYEPKKERNRDKVVIPFYMTSSSIKSLFLLDLYVNCLAEKQGILIIDEPELNLHPDNQRKMANLLARLVNAGVKILITTHSDYLIRELNNRIMLHGELANKPEIMRQSSILEQDLLSPRQVRAYAIKDDHLIHSIEIDKYGMNMKIFDDLIADANELSEKIYFGIQA